MKTYWMWELPDIIDTTCVVIDAWSATSNIASFINQKVRNLILVNISNLISAHKVYPDAIIAGESLNFQDIRFDISNAPFAVTQANAGGRDVLYMSINGTRAIEKVLKKSNKNVITAAFVNIKAVVNYLNDLEQDLTIILSGDEETRVEEDLLCNQAIIDLLNGKNINYDEIKSRSIRFLKSFYGAGETDINTVLDFGKYNIIPVCRKEDDGLIHIRKLVNHS